MSHDAGRMRNPLRILVSVAMILAFHTATESDGKRIHSFAGPFILYLDKSYQCIPDLSDGAMKIFIRPSHYRNPRQIQTELQRMTGNITFDLPGNDSYWIHLKVDMRSQNQWKENAFIFNIPGGGCTAMREYAPDAYRTVFKRDPKTKGTCVFPPGVHPLNELPLNFTFPKLAIMQYGHWRILFTGGILRRTTLCLFVEAKTLPKL